MINEIKENLETRISVASALDVSPDQMNYLAGLADALEIIEQAEEKQIKLGKEYYVLVWDERNRDTAIQKRTLSKITQTINKTAYCFTLDRRDCNPVVLYSKGGLASRVFNSIEDAERGKEHVYLDQKRQY